MTDDSQIEIRNDQADGKFEAWLGDQLVGVVVYERNGQRYLLTHAAVLPEYQHHGIGNRLIGGVLQTIRDEGATATIICPSVRTFVDHHPDYADVVDAAYPGVPSKAV